MPTKEYQIKELKIKIKNLEEMYDRLKDICSKEDQVILAIQENIDSLKERLERLERE